MAKLPGYDASVNTTTSPGSVLRDPAKESQGGRNVRKMGQAVKQVSAAWQQVTDFSDKVTAQDNMDKELQELHNRAIADPDYKNSEVYHQELADIRDKSLSGFSNNLARMEFSATANHQVNSARAQVDGIFRAKEIDHTTGKIVSQHEQNKNKFLANGDPNFKAAQIALAEEAFRRGFVTEVYVANEKIRVNDWDNLRYMKIAETDPERAIDMIKASDMLPTEKAAAISNVKRVVSQSQVKQELATIKTNIDVSEKLTESIKDPGKDYVAKLEEIEMAEKFGFPKADADRLRDNLLSADAISGVEHSEEMAKAIMMVDFLKVGLDKDSKKKDAIAYMKAIKDTKDQLLEMNTKGLITQGELEKLYGDIKKNSSTDETKGLGLIGKGSSWGYQYNDAKDTFDFAFEDNQAKSSYALRQFFYETVDRDLSGQEKKDKVAKIIDTMNGASRKEVAATVEVVRKTKPSKKGKETDVQLLKRLGYSEADVTENMKNYNLTREALFARLRKENG